MLMWFKHTSTREKLDDKNERSMAGWAPPLQFNALPIPLYKLKGHLHFSEMYT